MTISLMKQSITEKPLIAAHEAPAFECVNATSENNILLVCDHASNRIPESLNQLGLSDHELAQHIAYDIGAESVARFLAQQFDAPLLLSNYSRLVIDINRFPDDVTSIPEMSDGIEIPGNLGLPAQQKQQRVTTLFAPYQAEVAKLLAAMKRRKQTPFLISIHSFTPIFDGCQRPWHIGVLWNNEQQLSQQLIGRLRSHHDLCVGDNQPYHAVDPHGYTMATHAEGPGYPHFLLEIRQNLIDTEEKAQHWANLLYEEMNEVIKQHQTTQEILN